MGLLHRVDNYHLMVLSNSHINWIKMVQYRRLNGLAKVICNRIAVMSFLSNIEGIYTPY